MFKFLMAIIFNFSNNYLRCYVVCRVGFSCPVIESIKCRLNINGLCFFLVSADITIPSSYLNIWFGYSFVKSAHTLAIVFIIISTIESRIF